MKPRSTLKSYFTKGAIPKEADFADLIDSVLIQDEDTIFKSANDPLSIKATGAEEALLNFYRAEQGSNMLTWQLKQKPAGAGKPGLSIGDSGGDRLFIESGSGNVGIGTITPGAKLEVAQGSGLAIKVEPAAASSVYIGRSDVHSLEFDYAFGTVLNSSANLSFNIDSDNDDTNTRYVDFRTNGKGATGGSSLLRILENGNVGIGTTEPKAKLTVTGDLIRRVAIATGLGPGDDTDNGQIKSRVLSFSKQYDDTAIRILYCDNIRVLGTNVAPRWEIRIDGNSVPGGAIFQDKYDEGGNRHMPTTILGYATRVGAGVHEIQIWVSPAPGYPATASGGSPVDAYTGWLNSRWTIEAQEVWLK